MSIQNHPAEMHPENMHPGVRVGGWSWVWRPWIVLVTVVLAALTFLIFCVSISVGDFTTRSLRIR